NWIDMYLGDLRPVNRNMTMNKEGALNMPFTAYIPKKMPNAFYVYFKMTYTDLKDSIQLPFERIYLRNAISCGLRGIDVTDNDFYNIRSIVYHKYPYLK